VLPRKRRLVALLKELDVPWTFRETITRLLRASDVATQALEGRMIWTIGRAAIEPGTVIVHGSGAGFAQEISAGRHPLTADEPISSGGTDTGPNPYDLLLAAIGSCTSMTLAMYARRKGWSLEAVTITLRHSKIHAADCEACDTKDVHIDQIERDIELTGALSEEQRARLLEIANRCPVHRTLTSDVHIQTRLTTA